MSNPGTTKYLCTFCTKKKRNADYKRPDGHSLFCFYPINYFILFTFNRVLVPISRFLLVSSHIPGRLGRYHTYLYYSAPTNCEEFAHTQKTEIPHSEPHFSWAARSFEISEFLLGDDDLCGRTGPGHRF